MLLSGSGFASRIYGTGEKYIEAHNTINVPQAKHAMNKFKIQAAAEIGVNMTGVYNGHLTSCKAGFVGGRMVKKVCEVQSFTYTRNDRTPLGHSVSFSCIGAVLRLNPMQLLYR